MKKLNKLALNQETIRNLTTEELEGVVGGFATAKCTGACTQTCPCVCFGTCPPPAA